MSVGGRVMKQLSYLYWMVFCMFITLPMCFAQNAVDSGSSDINPEATSVMESYFRALTYGDLASLEMLLGGDLLSKRKMLLGNPSYSDYLINTYQDAEFKILKYENNGPDSVTVEVLVSFAQGETVRKRYKMERSVSNDQQISFVIVNETAVAEPMQNQGL